MVVRSALLRLLLLLTLALGGCFYALDGSLVKKARDGGADGARDGGADARGAETGAETGVTDSSPADGSSASD